MVTGRGRFPASSGAAILQGVTSVQDPGALVLDRLSEVATLAATALVAAQTEAGLNVALKSRDVIGQAKGILMERHRITDDEAFEILKRSSQRLNVRLAGVAEGVARTGESPATD